MKCILIQLGLWTDFSIGKYYDILDINGIIYISYNERSEVSQEEYNNYLNTHKCKLIGDVNGSK